MLATGRPRQMDVPPPTQEQIRRRPGNRAWVPRQHGAWGMLAIPPLVGLAVGGWSWVDLLVIPAWWAAYLTYWAWTQWLRTRSDRKRALLLPPLVLYTMVTAGLGLMTLAAAPYLLRWATVLLPLAAVAAHQVWRGKERSLLSGVVTTVTASLMTAVVYDLGTGGRGGWLGLGAEASTLRGASPDGSLTGWSWAWLVTAFLTAYFVGTVPYVKSMIRGRGDRGLLAGSVAFHGVVTLVAAACAVAGLVPWLHVVAWVALTTRAVWLPIHQVRRMRAGLPAVRAGQVGAGEVVACVLVPLSLLI